MAHPSVAVFERHIKLYRQMWRSTAFSFFVVPTLYMVSIGSGVGGYVGAVAGHSYLSWIAPGLLATLALQIGVSESTYGVYVEFAWAGGLDAMRATRVSIGDMLIGWYLKVLVVVLLGASVFLAVALAFGADLAPTAPLALGVCALLAMACTAPVAAFSASITSDSWFPLLFRFAVVPTTLFSGVFFPITVLPGALRVIAYALPLWHGVELCRAATLATTPAWPPMAHLAVLAGYFAAGTVLARARFRRRLIN